MRCGSTLAADTDSALSGNIAANSTASKSECRHEVGGCAYAALCGRGVNEDTGYGFLKSKFADDVFIEGVGDDDLTLGKPCFVEYFSDLFSSH